MRLHACPTIVWLTTILAGVAGAVATTSCGDDGSSAKYAGGSGDAGDPDATAATGDAGSGSDAGGRADASSPGDAGATPEGTRIADFVGVNGFIDDPVDKLAPIGAVREYHDWGWLADNFASGPAYPNMGYSFTNFNGWDWDTFYADIVPAGGSVFPAVQGGVPWIAGGAVPPVAQGADPTSAASYVAHGDVMFQIAARYGSTKVSDAKLKLRADQPRVSGLGTAHYFEDFNEEDLDAAFTADAFAAMASADYDGDQGRLGDTIGIKNADPGAQLVMGGLSGAYPTDNGTWVASITGYLDAMRAWSQAHRGGSFPADVLNVHLYSFGTGRKPPALSPEADGVKDKLAAVVAYRDQHLPGKQVWWTEFGYDVDAQSPLGVPVLGGNSAEVVQAQWLVRDLLADAAAGVDRATIFVLRDSCAVSDGSCHPEVQFNTSGLTTVKGQWTPKASWYFVAAFRSRLGSMVFAGERPSGSADVAVYAFRDTQSAGGALVVWAPTSSAKLVPGYALALPAGTTTVKAVSLVDEQPNGVEQPLVPSGGTVSIDVSETPLLVLVDSMP